MCSSDLVLDGNHSLVFHTHNWRKHDPDQGYMPDATPARDGYEGPWEASHPSTGTTPPGCSSSRTPPAVP